MRQAARNEAMGTKHYAGTTRVVNGHVVWTGQINAAPDHILTQPLRWKRPRRIFVNSMSDLFAEGVADATIDKVFAVMALCPQHTFQVLTKRPERMRDYMRGAGRRVGDIAIINAIRRGDPRGDQWGREDNFPWPLPNVWLGVSTEDQARAGERIPILLNTPAAVRFISAEPLLGHIDLQRYVELCHGDRDGDCLHDRCPQVRDGEPISTGRHCPLDRWNDADEGERPVILDWVIVGGESGPGARPMQPDWVRQIRDDCAAAGVPFFFKQWGEHVDVQNMPDDTYTRLERGGDERLLLDGPIRVGKHRGGRTLDGATHDGMPA